MNSFYEFKIRISGTEFLRTQIYIGVEHLLYYYFLLHKEVPGLKKKKNRKIIAGLNQSLK